MAKVKKVKARARVAARKKAGAKAKARIMAKRPAGKPKHVTARPVAKASASVKTARKEQIAKVLARLKLLPKNKTGKPQKLDKATLKKALLKERLARAKAEGKPRSTRGLTAREKALVKEFERRELSPADAEARRTRLKNLIVLGKERSYLTYAEINDHLPDDMLDAEQIETIISMINDMGIQVYDEAPDAETLLMAEVPARLPTRRRRRKPRRRSPPWIPSSAAPPIRCACTCARWARWSSSRAKARSRSPSASRTACAT